MKFRLDGPFSFVVANDNQACENNEQCLPDHSPYEWGYNPNFPTPSPYIWPCYYPNSCELPQNDPKSENASKRNTPVNFWGYYPMYPQAKETSPEKGRESGQSTPFNNWGVPYYSPSYFSGINKSKSSVSDSGSETITSESEKQSIPYWGYPPPPAQLFKPVKQKQPQSDSESDLSNCNTPVPYWDHYYFYNNENQTEQTNQYPPYWDPYYYYYYGYPPPMYIPYCYPPQNENFDATGGESSTDEMGYYDKKIPQQQRPPSSLEKPFNQTVTIETGDSDVSETEGSDTEVEEETTKKSMSNSLKTIRSVSDINVYINLQGDDLKIQQIEDELIEDEEDDVSDMTSEGNDATEEITENEMIPHQLSIIFEESERCESTKFVRESSILTNASDETVVLEDVQEEEVLVKLPVHLKYDDDSTEIIVGESEIIIDKTFLEKTTNEKWQKENNELLSQNDITEAKIETTKNSKIISNNECKIENIEEDSEIDFWSVIKSEDDVSGTPKGNRTEEIKEKLKEEEKPKKPKTRIIRKKQQFETVDLWEEMRSKTQSMENMGCLKSEFKLSDCLWSNIEDLSLQISSNNEIKANNTKQNQFIITDKSEESDNNGDEEDDSVDFWRELSKENGNREEIYTEELYDENDKNNEEYQEYDRVGTAFHEEFIKENTNVYKENNETESDDDFVVQTQENYEVEVEDSRELKTKDDEENETEYRGGSEDEEVQYSSVLAESKESQIFLAEEKFKYNDYSSDIWKKIDDSFVSKIKEIQIKQDYQIEEEDDSSSSSSDSSTSRSCSPSLIDNIIDESKINHQKNEEEEEEEEYVKEVDEYEEEDDPNNNNIDQDEEVQPLSIKDRIQVLQKISQKNSTIIKGETEIKISVKDRISALYLSTNENIDTPKSFSNKSSIKSFEENSEDEVDSGVTSDLSRNISEAEPEGEFTELRKMTRYQRAATHSRLYKLLQGECEEDDEDEEEEEVIPTKKVHNVSITRRNVALEREKKQKEEEMINRREQLSLPLSKNISEPESFSSSGINSPCSPVVNEKLVKELVQSLLRRKKGHIFRNMPIEKLHAAAIRILQEDMDGIDTSSEEYGSFMSPLRNSTSSTPAQTPQEFYGNYNEYKQYYDSWIDADVIESVPSKIHKGSSLGRCPRVLSNKNVPKELKSVKESQENSPSPDPNPIRPETNEASSAS